MKLFTIILLFSISKSLTVQSQNAQQNGRFTYQRAQQVNGIAINSEPQDLFYNGSESIYVIYQKRTPNDTLRMNDDKGEHKVVAANLNTGDFTYYKNYKARTMISKEILANGTVCQVHDTIPNLKWKLTTERKKIGPYTCQKATTTFRCADYVAWFTTAIPLSIGPWKLGGLPGLIVEVTNKRIDATYLLLSADYPSRKINYPIAPQKTKDPVYSFANFATTQLKEQDKLRVFQRGTSTSDSQKEIKFNGPECYDKP